MAVAWRCASNERRPDTIVKEGKQYLLKNKRRPTPRSGAQQFTVEGEEDPQLHEGSLHPCTIWAPFSSQGRPAALAEKQCAPPIHWQSAASTSVHWSWI